MSGWTAGRNTLPETPGDVRGSDVMIRVALTILATYMTVAALPLLAWSMTERTWLPLTTHLAALAVTFLCASRRNLPRWRRDWLPLALVPLLYVELRWVIAGFGRPHADALIAAWDLTLFGEPSRTLALRWHSVFVSELLHLCYIAYYAIVYVPPALLWLKGRHREFAATTLALVIMYTICFIAFVLLPVDGPRFLSGPSAAPEGPIRAIVIWLLDAGSSRGTAFPSAHVAASVVAALYALRFQRTLGIAIVVLTAGMMVGAVYGGYHYAVDVIAGLVTGLLSAAIARAVEHAITGTSAAPR